MPQSPTSHRNPEPITRVAAIKTFFGCSLQELKDLTPEDKNELGPLCAAALGHPLKTS